MRNSVEIRNVFNILSLKQIFRKRKTFFKKLEYSFLVESTNIEKATFLYKTILSEANVKINRMESTKCTYHKEWHFIFKIITTLFFWKFYFSLRTFYNEFIWYTNYLNAHIRTFFMHCSFVWGCCFPVSILKQHLLRNCYLAFLSILLIIE